jgi:hypothetical protein
MDDAQIIADLRSGNIERQAAALDEAARAVRALLSEAVRTLITAESPFAAASKLIGFGPPIVSVLEDALREPMSENTRNHVAALLVELGSTAGVPHLLSVLEQHNENFVMAALVLGKARVKEAAPLIQEVVERWDYDADPYSAGTLIEALKKLDALPGSLKNALRQRWPRHMNSGLEELLRE